VRELTESGAVCLGIRLAPAAADILADDLRREAATARISSPEQLDLLEMAA
jgi:hypothetical protein